MPTPRETVLLRIFFGEADRHCHQPLYEAIVLKAREMHLATVIRGQWAMGISSRLHAANTMRLSFDLRVIVDIVDRSWAFSRCSMV